MPDGRQLGYYQVFLQNTKAVEGRIETLEIPVSWQELILTNKLILFLLMETILMKELKKMWTFGLLN